MILHAQSPSTVGASLSIRAAMHRACFCCWQVCRHAQTSTSFIDYASSSPHCHLKLYVPSNEAYLTWQAGVGVPIACNRGASGIDGVLSTAAGYAAGLRRGVTLVIGDVSFLHDCNGLSLLRTGGHLSGPAAAASQFARSIGL